MRFIVKYSFTERIFETAKKSSSQIPDIHKLAAHDKVLKPCQHVLKRISSTKTILLKTGFHSG